MNRKLTLDNMTDKQREEMCSLCAETFYEGNVNTNQYNLCEGSRCEEAFELYKDTIEEQIAETKKDLGE